MLFQLRRLYSIGREYWEVVAVSLKVFHSYLLRRMRNIMGVLTEDGRQLSEVLTECPLSAELDLITLYKSAQESGGTEDLLFREADFLLDFPPSCGLQNYFSSIFDLE